MSPGREAAIDLFESMLTGLLTHLSCDGLSDLTSPGSVPRVVAGAGESRTDGKAERD